MLQHDLSHHNSHGGRAAEQTEFLIPVNTASGASGSKPGLFRTPISGGVHSATSAHDLPRPALAVRNLMEQVRLLFRY